MSDWADEVEEALASLAGAAGGARHTDRRAPSSLAMEAANGKVTSHLLTRGIALTTLLGRCALAEAEDESDCGEYRRELAAAAKALIADWEALQAICRQVGISPERIVGKGEVAYMTRRVVHLAQKIVARDG